MYCGGIGHNRWPTCGSIYPFGRIINFVTIDASQEGLGLLPGGSARTTISYV